jgi:hypothetical protein
MPKSIAIITVLMSTLAFTASAGEYSFYSLQDKASDFACLKEIRNILTDKLNTEYTIEVEMPNPWDSSIDGYRIFYYADVHVESKFGASTGGAICTLRQQNLSVVEIALQFDGRGLPGVPNRILQTQGKPIEEQTMQFYVKTLFPLSGEN